MTDMTQKQVDAHEAAKVVGLHGPTTIEQPTIGEMKIKRAAVLQVRRFFFGPRCAPRLKDQARSFVSFGTLIKLEALNDVRSRN